MTTVSDNQYLSIGEVLGLLLEDFPDVTISKIRFLESQGLIEPERTPSGYRKFYDHDVDLLRAILHEQRENFLPLKVIRDRIESGTIETDPTGARTPPRGIRNVEVRDSSSTPPAAAPATDAVAARDSVFRRTDGGPEWADGRALIPGDLPGTASRHPSAGSSTGAVPVTPSTPSPAAALLTVVGPRADEHSAPASATASRPPVANASRSTPPPSQPVTTPTPAIITHAAAPSTPPSARSTTRPTADTSVGLPYSRDELCLAAAISEAQLKELDEFGIVPSRGSGSEATYQADAVAIARVAGRFLEQGIDARHLRSWRQGAERESALFEQRIMPLLRQRNPQSRQQALQALTELADLGSQLRSALIDSLLRHHFDGS